MKAQEKRQFHAQYGSILMISAWGMAMVVASFLFLYVGYMLDKWLNTPPTFMFGLFFLALITSIGRLYQEAWRRRKDV
jgi:hypothetical protein